MCVQCADTPGGRPEAVQGVEREQEEQAQKHGGPEVISRGQTAARIACKGEVAGKKGRRPPSLGAVGGGRQRGGAGSRGSK